MDFNRWMMPVPEISPESSPRQQAVDRLRGELEEMVKGREWVTPFGDRVVAFKVMELEGGDVTDPIGWVVDCEGPSCPNQLVDLDAFIYPAVLTQMFRYAFAGLEDGKEDRIRGYGIYGSP